MHICLAILYYDAHRAHLAPQEYLAEFPFARHLPRALAARGHRVDVVWAYPRAERFGMDGAEHYFVPPASGSMALASLLGWLSGREASRALWLGPAVRHIAGLQPDVVHVSGLILTGSLWQLQRALGDRPPALVGHYHGGHPAENRLLRRLQRSVLRRLDRALFTVPELAEPFLDAGMLIEGQIARLVEVSTPFRRRDRDAARQETGLQGSPIFLWTGRLHPLKDPLTALRGFEQILVQWPRAELYMYYLTAELQPQIETFLAQRPALAGHVHLRGRAPQAALEPIYNSADFFLQASRREYAGYALLEALACGVIPVVSDIPAFRMITADGRYGLLFPPGDPAALASRVLALDPAGIRARSAETAAYFQQELSFEAMARQLSLIYGEILAQRAW